MCSFGVPELMCVCIHRNISALIMSTFGILFDSLIHCRFSKGRTCSTNSGKEQIIARCRTVTMEFFDILLEIIDYSWQQERCSSFSAFPT